MLGDDLRNDDRDHVAYQAAPSSVWRRRSIIQVAQSRTPEIRVRLALQRSAKALWTKLTIERLTAGRTQRELQNWKPHDKESQTLDHRCLFIAVEGWYCE